MNARTFKVGFFLCLIFSIPLYIGLSYFTPRSNFGWLICEFGLLFLLYFLALWLLHSPSDKPLSQKTFHPPISLLLLVGVGIFFRLLLLPSLPNLSDDYFRFIWDGRLLVQGIPPFLYTPENLMEMSKSVKIDGLSQELFEGMNSPGYFTIYPPVNQLIFWLGAVLSPQSISGSVWVMKFCILLAEVGNLFLLKDLLKRFKLPGHWIAFYALNPLVVVELSANLHFEAFLIFFLLLTLWTLLKYPYWVASLPFALAIASKLLPLMFFPLFIRRLGWRKTILFSLLSFFWLGLMFTPLLDLNTLFHMFDSIGLYFQSFEFNASIYYLVRWWGYQEYGYNIIQSAGKNLAALVFALIWVFVVLEKKPVLRSLPVAMMWVLFIYFSGASIVHPWYVCTLVALCSLSNFRFPILWTSLLPLTYFTYRTEAYTENLWLVGIEYFLLWSLLIWELWKNTRTIPSEGFSPGDGGIIPGGNPR